MKILSALVLMVVLFLSCQSIEKVDKPEPFIAEQMMENMLFDVAVMNAARGYSPQKLKKNGISPERYIFEKYGVDSLAYADNTVYYATNADAYKEMYQNVERRITVLSDSLDVVVKEEKRVKDSIAKAENKTKRKGDSLRRSKGDTLIKPRQDLNGFSTFSVKEVLRDSI